MSLPISYPQPPTLIPALGLGSGTVTSVGVSAPPEFTVANSPLTTAGTIVLNKATQPANNVWAGPAAGPAAQPSFRPLAIADLPPGTGTVTSVGLTMPAEYAVANSPVTGANTLAVTKTNQSANQVYAGPAAGAPAQPTFRALATADLPAGTGTVTSVGLTVPVEFNVANSPVTGADTLAVTKATQPANTFWAGPVAGPDDVPTFRAIDPADVAAVTPAWADVLIAGNSSGATNPTIDAGQRIQYNGSLLIGSNGAAPVVGGAGANQTAIGGGATVNRPDQTVVGRNAVAGTNADGSTVMGVGAFTGAAATNGAVFGNNASASGVGSSAFGSGATVPVGHTRSSAFGIGATTTVANQMRLGTATENVSIPGNLQVDQYIRSLQQKACVAGITPGTSALQALPVAATTTLDIKDTLFDPLGMVNLATDRISVTDTQQCWGVSAMVRGDFGGLNPGALNWTMQLIWFDGAADRIIGEHQLPTVANVNSWSTTLATGMRTNANAGQYLYCRLTNNTLQTMNLTHFRFSVTRVA